MSERVSWRGLQMQILKYKFGTTVWKGYVRKLWQNFDKKIRDFYRNTNNMPYDAVWFRFFQGNVRQDTTGE